MKIALVLDDSMDRNDGVQQYVRSLGGWLTDNGHTVHYLAGESNLTNSAIRSMSKNINVRFNGNKLSVPLPASSLQIKKVLHSERYDIIHIQMPYSPLMAGKIISNAPSGTAIVGTFHILPLGRMQRYGTRALAVAQKRQIKRFDAICSVSAPACDFARSCFGITSMVIPNMIDIARWDTGVRPHPFRIVFLGRLVPRKGCSYLLAALASLPPKLLSQLEIIIAGDGPERPKLEKFAEMHQLSNVTFLGFIDENQKPGLLASAHLAIFPSLGGESFGIVLIEAMAAGAKVVIGGDNLGYKSVLSEWPETLIDPHNTTQFSVMIEKFLNNKKLCNNIHSKQQHAVRQYDTNVVGDQVLGIYKETLLHRQQKMR